MRLELGALRLYRNRLADARRDLELAVHALPDSVRAKRLLAECCYRMDDYPEAARLFRAAGDTAVALKLESFGTTQPYRVEGTRAELPFVVREPLPLVEVSVNGGLPVTFLVDTGGGEVVLDPGFADSAGVRVFGAGMATFAGDRRARVTQGRIDRLSLGAVIVHDVPVHLLSTRAWSAALGRPVMGVIGTILLSRFRATLDYPEGRLVLEPRTPRAAALASPGRHDLPFWMAGDHLLLGEGSLESGPSHLFLIDTGLAGLAFTAPLATLAEAHVAIADTLAGGGIGGGGRLSVAPFSIGRLALGDVVERDLTGVYGPFPASLEHGQGFRVAGLVSHAFFRAWRVTLDFDAMRIVLEPPATPPVASPTIK